MSTFNYDNTYTRAADTTNVFPAQQIGLSLAAFMLGMPTIGVDRRQPGVRRPQQLFRDVRAGHLAREPEPDAQRRPAARV